MTGELNEAQVRAVNLIEVRGMVEDAWQFPEARWRYHRVPVSSFAYEYQQEPYISILIADFERGG